jgi:hypothetical protein
MSLIPRCIEVCMIGSNYMTSFLIAVEYGQETVPVQCFAGIRGGRNID